jgi:hypothetical protein
METCTVTFDVTQPCSSTAFECVGDDEIGEKIFEDEKEGVGDDEGDDGEPPASHVPSTSNITTTIQEVPSPTPTMTHQDQVEAATKGEVVFRREAPRRVQADHPPS